MPLDPDMEAVLNEARAHGWPPNSFNGLSVSDVRDLARTPPDAAMRSGLQRDILNVPGPFGPIPLRLYRPHASATSLPVFVYFHGGGFVLRDMDGSDAHFVLPILKRVPCAVISVDYRVAPEHKFPAAVEDAYAALTWIHERARALGIDPSRMAVGGDSAGGNLATVMTHLARDRGGPPIIQQVLMCPNTNRAHTKETQSYQLYSEQFWLRAEMIQWFVQTLFKDPSEVFSPLASPALNPVLENLPPALIQVAEYDPLRDEAEAYAALLKRAGVPVVLTRYNGVVHDFMGHSNSVTKAREAMDEVSNTLRTAFEQ